LRIAIVNDLPMALEVLRRVVASGGHTIVWTAADGTEAVDKCLKDKPDLILMDLIMPVMDGVQATGAIMRNSPCAILVVTASVGGNAAKVFEAMGHGALDAVCTPAPGAGGQIGGDAALLKKIATIGKLIHVAPALRREPVAPMRPRLNGALIAIGASTGGPKALAAVLAALPGDCHAPVVLVQHLDPQFVDGLAEWLGGQTELKVQVAAEGARPQPGTVYIAGSADHLVLAANGSFHYTPEPADYPYRPSVDEFFLSLAARWREPGVAVLLTGMGRDGARGLLALRQARWHTIAQDAATSIVYGMPKAAMELDAAVEQLPLLEISDAIGRQLGIGVHNHAR
jgi:two-component system, chemotaxis family, response regulator WspF